MPITVACPTCGARLKVPDTAPGTTVTCPKCAAALSIPPARPAEPPPPVVRPRPPVEAVPADEDDAPRRSSRRSRRRDDEDEDDEEPPRRRSSRRRDYDDYDDDRGYRDRPPGEAETDAPGVLGLVFGVIAILCLLLGCFTCGMTYFAAAPLAAVGAGCSAFGRGNVRVAGLALNLLTLLPAIVLFGMMLFGAGAGAIAPPRR